MATIWLILVIAGPILLAAVIAYSMLNNKLTRRQRAERDAATRQLREEDADERRDGAV